MCSNRKIEQSSKYHIVQVFNKNDVAGLLHKVALITPYWKAMTGDSPDQIYFLTLGISHVTYSSSCSSTPAFSTENQTFHYFSL